MTRLNDPFVQKQRRTITAYREETTRLKAINADLLEALKGWLSPYDGWSDIELMKRTDVATRQRIVASRAAIAKAEPHDLEGGNG